MVDFLARRDRDISFGGHMSIRVEVICGVALERYLDAEREENGMGVPEGNSHF